MLAVVDDYLSSSDPVSGDIVVLPINDPPEFHDLKAGKSYSEIYNATLFKITGTVSDIDFLFKRHLIINASIEESQASLGQFVLPNRSDVPCILGDNGIVFYSSRELGNSIYHSPSIFA